MPRKEKYAEQLKDPRWQKARLRVFERDGFACTLCGSTTKTLHVHHKTYERGKAPWEYDLENFATLCEECHGNEHTERPVVERAMLDAMRRHGFLWDSVEALASAFEAMEWRGGQVEVVTALMAFLTDRDGLQVDLLRLVADRAAEEAEPPVDGAAS